MLFRLPTVLIKLFRHPAFYRIAERMRMDPVVVRPGFHRVAKVGLSPSGGSDDFFLYEYATGTIQGLPAERTVPMKCQKVYDGPVRPESAPAVDVNWLSDVACKTIFEVNRDCRRNGGVSDGDEGTPDAVPAYIVHEVDYVFAQRAL